MSEQVNSKTNSNQKANALKEQMVRDKQDSAPSGKTLLDGIINLEVSIASTLMPVQRTKNVVYLCKVKANSTTEPFLEITGKIDIAKYTEDPFAGNLFDNGMNKIILAFEDNSPDFGILASLAYTLIFGKAVDIKTNVTAFDGVKVYSAEKVDAASTILVASPKTCVMLAKADEGLAAAIFGKFIAQNALTDMQYGDFSAFTPVIANIGELDNARDKGYTFIAKDATTITSPVLMYFRAGNLPIASIYITENLKQDIQVACYNLIKNNKLPYSNVEIAELTTAGEQVIDNYINFGLIEKASFYIPPKERQLNTDIIKGLLNNVKTAVTLNASIWRLKGNIKAEY